jgi:hypothetical protein
MKGEILPLSLSERGKKGGQKTLEEHGTQRPRPVRCRFGVKKHMQIIGRAGYESTLERHYAGDAKAMHSHLLKLRHAPKTWCERSQCWRRAA